MLKVGDLAHREDHRVRWSKLGEPDEIRGYHMYAFCYFDTLFDVYWSSDRLHKLTF